MPLDTNLFASALEIGDGYACEATPFDGFVVTDYYDGPVAGFCRTKGGSWLIFFHLAWWDENQSNRVFDVLAVDIAVARADEPQLIIDYEQRSKDTNWAHSSSDKDRKSHERLREYFFAKRSALRFTIMCRQIFGSMFILPVVED